MADEKPTPHLHEVEPREQNGAMTGERYDFQYHEAAAGALQVLDDTKVACVYCEWHDDYVVETAGIRSYRFHQVKTRAASQGPWTVNEFFGVKRPKGRKPKKAPPKLAARTDSIFGRLFDHVAKFGDRCQWFVFVSDAGAETSLHALIDGAHTASGYQALQEPVSSAFAELCSALQTVFPKLVEENLFRFLGRLYLQEAIGKLSDLKGCRTLIGARIRDLSEVDLRISEAQKIGDELVALVREKSHRKLMSLPSTDVELRRDKGLVLEDVLRILSLSAEGYRELKLNGRQAVIALSRLHRRCRSSKVPENLIPELCRMKASWDTWWVLQRHRVSPLDYTALKKECVAAIQAHASGALNFNDLNAEAQSIATKYGPLVTSTEPLDKELVFGLMLTVVAEAEQ